MAATWSAIRLWLVRVASGLDQPVSAVSPAGDPRLFVVEQFEALMSKPSRQMPARGLQV